MSHKICSMEGCVRPARVRGWCSTHYERWRKHGDPTVVLESNPRGPRRPRGPRPAEAQRAEFVAVFEDWGGLSRPRLHRQALLQLADMLDDRTTLTPGAEWTFEHVPAVLPGEPGWLIARHPATTTAAPADLAPAARAVADRARGALPALVADIERRLADALGCGEVVAA